MKLLFLSFLMLLSINSSFATPEECIDRTNYIKKLRYKFNDIALFTSTYKEYVNSGELDNALATINMYHLKLASYEHGHIDEHPYTTIKSAVKKAIRYLFKFDNYRISILSKAKYLGNDIKEGQCGAHVRTIPEFYQEENIRNFVDSLKPKLEEKLKLLKCRSKRIEIKDEDKHLFDLYGKRC